MRSRWTAVLLAVALPLVACSADRRSEAGAGGEPQAGTWRTWVLSSGSEGKVPPPPSGAAARAEEAEVRTRTRERTADVEDKIRRWGQHPAIKAWHDVHLELVAAGVKNPPLAARGYALSAVAMYDAVVSAWHWKHTYDRKPPAGVDRSSEPGPDPSYPSEHAAIAGAASRVLAYVFPDRPAERFDLLAEEAALSRVQAGANFPSDVQAGLELGRAVADRVIGRAKADGAERRWDGSRPAGIGRGPQYWEPSPGTVTPPTEPLAGTWRTWVLSSGSQFRPGPPPPFGSPQLLAEAREVMEVRARLTPEQERIARFWAGGQGSTLPPGLWNQVAMVYIQRARLSTPRAARTIALLNMAQADAAVSCWDTKFTYWSPRPENVIRDLGLDPQWKPLIASPPFPSYTSGHSTFSGAASEVLAYLFPDGATSFREKAEEAAVSRLYGGIHFRSDNDVGLDVGRKIGALVVTKAKDDGADQ